MFEPVSRLDGRVAVVVGGAGAIGAAAARRLATLGARVALVQRRADGPEVAAVLGSLPGQGHRAYAASITESATLHSVAQRIRDDMGPASILINSAGTTAVVPVTDLDGLSDELIDQMFRINWRGPFATIRAFAPQMREAPDAVVINVSSIAGSTGQGSNLAYAASKAATDLMTKALGKALGPGLRVVGIAPGVVNTPFVPGRGADFNQKAAATTPLRRVGEADDVAAGIEALVTTLAFATGTTLILDGGRHLVA
jgi:3-oxoacyl-[acyl-carrier protein] reductase